MKIFQTFAMAIKNIFLNKTRTMLTMLGIIIGVASVITIVSVMQGMQQKSLDEFNSMGTNRIDVYYSSWTGIDLTQDLYQFCKGLDDSVSGVTPNARGSVRARYQTKNMDNLNVNYANEDYDLCNNLVLAKGRGLVYSDVKNRVRVCTLGASTAKQLFGLSDPIGKDVKLQGYNFKVVGVYTSKYPDLEDEEWSPDSFAVVPYTLQRTLAGRTTIDQFIVKAKDAGTTEAAITQIKEFLRPYFKNEWDYNVYSNSEWQNQYQEQQAMLTLVVAGIASISLLVGGIGIMNIMLVSVTERTREIGIRMAIGAQQRSIVWQFLIESATVSAFGGLIGIGIGTIGSVLLSSALLKEIYYPTPIVCLAAFGFSALLGMFFGFYPAFKAAKMQPVEALRTN